MTRFSNNVKKYREKLGLTQVYMADVFKITPSAYNQKERGKTRFSHNEMMVIKTLVNRDVNPNATIDDIFFASD